MKIGLYARVSDDKKKTDGERRQDVKRQVDLLTPIILSRHPERSKRDIEIYIDDGKSAFTEDWNSRPDFKRLINDIRRHHIQEFWIEDMTRFSRRIDIGLPIMRELGALNAHMISVKEGELEVTSSKGWMQSAMLLMFAEWDSRIKSDKVKEGMKRAKNLGKKIGGFRGNSKGGQKPSPNHTADTALENVSLKPLTEEKSFEI